jgi:hypothetical protein
MACAVFGVDGVNGDQVQDKGSAQTLFLLKAIKPALAEVKAADRIAAPLIKAWGLHQATGQDWAMPVNSFCTGAWMLSCGLVWGVQ